MNPKHALTLAREGLSLLAEHETNALGDHLLALNRRVRVARKARSLGELLRDQLDLLPDTGARLHRDQRLRLQLLTGLRRDLRNAP
ncbi:MAG: hypothetical protein Q8Q73_12880 [Stagnimonas sp.]|nr:hypothetical protein [Stagnimonas sp.]